MTQFSLAYITVVDIYRVKKEKRGQEHLDPNKSWCLV